VHEERESKESARTESDESIRRWRQVGNYDKTMSRMSFYSFESGVIQLFYSSPFKCYIHGHTPHVYGWRSSLRGEAREKPSEVGFVKRCRPCFLS
jgi:hypothetical protein